MKINGKQNSCFNLLLASSEVHKNQFRMKIDWNDGLVLSQIHHSWEYGFLLLSSGLQENPSIGCTITKQLYIVLLYLKILNPVHTLYKVI